MDASKITVFRTKITHAFIKSARLHLPLLILLIAYVAIIQLLAWKYGYIIFVKNSIYLPLLFRLIKIFLLLIVIVYTFFYLPFRFPKTGSLFTKIKNDIWKMLTLERIFNFVWMFMIYTIFADNYRSVKTMGQYLHPFAWDRMISNCDQWLHFNHYPWEWLQPILGYSVVSSALSVFYHTWFFVMICVVLWQASSLNIKLRMQFFLAFFLCWIFLGGAMAIFFSSAGPVFYGKVLHLSENQNPYSALMEYLHLANLQHSVLVLDVQEKLWQSFVMKAADAPISGISAMPSMHVSMSVLFALVGYRANRYLGMALWLFAGIIFLGSIHLAYHYALDGYVSCLFTVLIWKLAGWPKWVHTRAI